MVYEIALYLIGSKIRKQSIPEVERAVTTWKAEPDAELGGFLECAAIDNQGCLAFRSQNDGSDLYEPCEGEDTVPARIGKWRSPESIANWINTTTGPGDTDAFSGKAFWFFVSAIAATLFSLACVRLPAAINQPPRAIPNGQATHQILDNEHASGSDT